MRMNRRKYGMRKKDKIYIFKCIWVKDLKKNWLGIMDSLSIYKEKKKGGKKFVDSNIGLYETVMPKVHMDLGIHMGFDLK